MTALLYYSAPYVTRGNPEFPGMSRFEKYFRIYNYGVAPVDRTGTIKLPIHTKVLFPMPAYRRFSTSFEDVCNARARQILVRSEETGLPIFIFWSGGIDSTLALISLLKMSSDEQKKRLTVLLSEESIEENPRFFEEHIRGRLTYTPGTMFSYMIGLPRLLINGEHNDQIFGSDIMESVIKRFGPAIINAPLDLNVIRTFFSEKLGDEKDAEFFVRLFDRLAHAAPVPIDTTHNFFWWINFSMKWQTVSMRSLAYAAKRNFPLVTAEYIERHYIPFYNTDEFQLWSMNNPDKKIKDSWRTYKWAAKEVIYEYTKDADYRDNKIKRGSLTFLIFQQRPVHFIDESYRFLDHIPPVEYCVAQNDFV